MEESVILTLNGTYNGESFSYTSNEFIKNINNYNNTCNELLEKFYKNYNISSIEIPENLEFIISSVEKNKYKNYINSFSNISCPSSPNNNEFVKFEYIDNPDFTLNPNDNSQLICNNPGKWFLLPQFQTFVVNDSDYSSNSQIDCWVVLNGVPIYGDDAGFVNINKNEAGVFPLGFVGNFKKGDFIQYGVRSTSLDGNLNIILYNIPTSTGVNCPSVILSGFKILTNIIPDSSTKGFFNVSTTLNLPYKANNNEYVYFDNIDSYDFNVDLTDNSKLICNNPGKWLLFAQCQPYIYNQTDISTDSTIDFWFSINNNDIPNSDQSISMTLLGKEKVITNSFIYNFALNDILKFGLRSNSLNNNINIGFNTVIAPSGILDAPAVIEAVKLPSFHNELNSNFLGYSNIISNISSPKLPNNNEFIFFENNYIISPDFSLDQYDNSKLVCNNSGKWLILAQFQVYSFKKETKENNTQIDCWLNKNGTIFPNSNSSDSANILGGLNNLTLLLILELKEKDFIQFGIRSSSLDNKLNSIIKSFLSKSDVNNPAIVLSLAKIDEL